MLNFLDGWSVGKVVPAVAVELGDSYSVGACIISWHSLVQLCGGDPSPLRGMNFTTRPRSPDLGNASYREDRLDVAARRRTLRVGYEALVARWLDVNVGHRRCSRDPSSKNDVGRTPTSQLCSK